MSNIPSQADIVIVGGGIIGSSIAYQLGKAKAKDVVLLEKNELTHGSTWHAAGMVGQLRASRNLSRLLQTSVQIYQTLEQETGLATGWRQTGSIRLASTDERYLEIKRSRTTAHSVGLEAEILSPSDARKLFPILETDGLKGALYVPGDGVADPTSLTLSFAAGARQHGVRIVQSVRVTGFVREGRRIRKVLTDRGEIACRVVVNTAGVWAREIGAMMGVDLACCGLVHQYLVTEPLAELDSGMPSVRDPDLSIYYKPEANGLVVGCWEPDTATFDKETISPTFGRELLAPAMDRLEPFIEKAMLRTPILAELGIRDVITGPIPFSADGDFVMGPVPSLDDAYVASGCVVGIAAGGGIGKAMAEWILNGEPSMDLWPVDVRRFGAHHGTTSYLYSRAVEIYGDHYKLQPPGYEHHTMRGLRRSPLHGLLKQRRAVYGSKYGWERPNWFAPLGVEPVDRPSFVKPNWFDAVAEEHKSVRRAAGVLDLSSFAKFEIHGLGALATLQHLSVRDLDRPVGTTIYTQLCNERGGIEADVTISRLAEDRFYFVTGTGNGVRDMEWIRANAPGGASFDIEDVTSSRAVLLLTGPKAPAILGQLIGPAELTRAAVDSSCCELTIGGARVRSLKLSFAGEPGWELHVPSEFACHVYETLVEVGSPCGLVDFGYRALDSLRIEKGYRYWGSDITPDYNPYEAGLGFCVDLQKGPFLARQALAAAKEKGPARRLCTFTLDRQIPVFGGEALVCDGRIVGATTSGAFGHSIGKPVVCAYVSSDLLGNDNFQVEAFGERVGVTRSKLRDLVSALVEIA